MQRQQSFIEYKLIGGKKPVNFEVPLKNVMLTKKGSQGGRLIQYVKGSDSIFKEDHKGDEKPEKIWIENGTLRVHRANLPLIEIMDRHPLSGVEWETFNADKEAIKKLSKYQLIEKALGMVNIANNDEKKANALVLIGEHMLDASEQMVTSELKEKAFESPKDVIDQMNTNDYQAKYVAALAILKGVVLINSSRTAITWADGKVLVTVPVGQSPIEKLGALLGGNSEESKITMQEIGEKTKRPYIRQIPIDIDAEILKVNAAKELAAELAIVEVEPELLEARNLYSEKFEKSVPPNKKNDTEWLLSKVNEQ